MITALDKKTALVIIDLQNGIVKLPLARSVSEIISNNLLLIDAFRKAGLPIVIVNVNPSDAAWTKSRKDAKQPAGNAYQSAFFEIIPEIKIQPEDILITKHTWSAFYETSLHERLQQAGVTGIVLSGISTSIGVEATARAASERAYNITFAMDAMTDMFAEAHEHSLKYIFPRIGETGNTQQVIEAVSRL